MCSLHDVPIRAANCSSSDGTCGPTHGKLVVKMGLLILSSGLELTCWNQSSCNMGKIDCLGCSLFSLSICLCVIVDWMSFPDIESRNARSRPLNLQRTNIMFTTGYLMCAIYCVPKINRRSGYMGSNKWNQLSRNCVKTRDGVGDNFVPAYSREYSTQCQRSRGGTIDQMRNRYTNEMHEDHILKQRLIPN